MNRNYQKEFENELNMIETEYSDRKPRLLLHACCAPCSSHVLDYISRIFDITVMYYNPNIFPEDEFKYRLTEIQRLVREMDLQQTVNVIAPEYNPDEFFEAVKGYEHFPEGSERCYICYELRLRKTAMIAQQKEYDYFATTLSISPLKNVKKINEIGEKVADEYSVKYLVSDFKKKDGYKHSIELSRKYNLYRQNFCGCVYSKH
ncbi:MAG: epoxyqueuosine reductase QueH [Eubacterium sp.]